MKTACPILDFEGMVGTMLRRLAILLIVARGLEAVPLFNTITLEEFGAMNNSNTTLQPVNTFTKEDPPDSMEQQPLRTNDFQVLQQEAAENREIVRVNQFYVSQGPEGVGLTLPAVQIATTAAITTPIDDFQMIFGATESQDLDRTTNLLSSQMLTVTYSLPVTGAQQLSVPPTEPPPPETPQLSYLFECTAPVIRTGGPQITTLLVDGVAVDLSRPIPPGLQFVIELQTGLTFFLDVTQSALPVLFTLDGGGTELASAIPFTGFLSLSCSAAALPDTTFNAFQRNDVSPFLNTNGPTIDAIVIDGVPVPESVFNPPPGEPFGPLPPGRNFQLFLSSGEIWFIETDPLFPPVLFLINTERTVFRSSIFFTGIVRFACVDINTGVTPNEFFEIETTSILFVPPAVVTAPRTPPQTILDYNVIGNAYHDIEYNQLTPEITFQGNAELIRLFIDDLEQSLTTPEPFPAGTKFRLDFQRELPNGMLSEQTWLIYVEQSFEPPFPEVTPGTLGVVQLPRPLVLDLGLNATSLVAVEPFTGILRVASVQPGPIPNVAPPEPNPMIGPFWSTAAVTQTMPVTPIAMYLLWPTEWTALLGPQITSLVPRGTFVPACSRIAELLPALALTDFRRSIAYFQQIIPENYFPTSNPFLNFFLLTLGRELSGDIALYQAIFRPMPVYAITPTPALTEAAYDASRSIIPIAADITFEPDAYHWTYTTIDDAQDPLILFPDYKTLDPFIHPTPVAGFAYQDAIKGRLLGVTAVECQVNFIEGPVPLWYTTGFIPDFFPLTGNEIGTLQRLFSGLEPPQITATSLNEVGEQLLELALDVTFAVFVYDRNPALRAFIKGFTSPFTDVIKETLNQWLITHVDAAGQPLLDFFSGDLTQPGVCGVQGMFAQAENIVNSIDQGNAIYNLHHSQYGFWLLTVGLLIQWDDRFQPDDPWIAQLVTLADGTMVKRKDFVDFLWRDARNVDKDDPEQLPFNRHGNPWEGHGTDNGVLYTPLPKGRFQESWAEDFNSWVGTNQYARAVLATPALDAADKAGFARLAVFSQTNMELTATSGKLIYQDASWIYGPPYNINVTVGQVFDSQTLAETTLDLGTPPCEILTPS